MITVSWVSSPEYLQQDMNMSWSWILENEKLGAMKMITVNFVLTPDKDMKITVSWSWMLGKLGAMRMINYFHGH